MTGLDEEFKTKFMVYVNSKANKVSNSFTITQAKRDRIIRCLKNPQSEPSSKFRFWVRQKNFRLIQSEENEGDIVGIPADEKDGDEILYKRAACLEEFWDLINTAHVENGHIGLSSTYAAIRRVYALLPRCLVARFIQLCPICRRTARQSYQSRSKDPPAILPATRLVDGGSINKSDLNQTITVVTTNSPAQFEALGSAEIITDGTLQASAIGSIISQEGLSNSDVIAEITLNETEDGQTVAVVSETSAHNHIDDVPQTHAMETQTPIVGMDGDNSGINVASHPAPVVIFNCHICNKQFEKKLTYQRHLRTHSEHNPTMPVVGPPIKKIKVERRSKCINLHRSVILDVDMGIDAAQALMLAASRSDVDILAVTCVGGTVNIEHACNNALRVLKACNREDIPVFRGAEKPLVGEANQSEENLPGVAWDSNVDVRQIEPEHAVSALIRFVNDSPGQITLLCLGPLTNLALALRLDPQVAKKLKDVFILGGNVEGRGNCTPCAEQNFYYDPEAAHIVLQEMTNITLLPYEVCTRNVLSGEFFYSWVQQGTVKSEFIRTSSSEAWLQHNYKFGYASNSSYAMAVAIDSNVALETESVHATVELSGVLSRGMMVVDWSKVQGHENNVRIVKSLDLIKIQSFLAAMVNDDALDSY